jgi:hypothetical protein
MKSVALSLRCGRDLRGMACFDAHIIDIMHSPKLPNSTACLPLLRLTWDRNKYAVSGDHSCFKRLGFDQIFEIFQFSF